MENACASVIKRSKAIKIKKGALPVTGSAPFNFVLVRVS